MESRRTIASDVIAAVLLGCGGAIVAAHALSDLLPQGPNLGMPAELRDVPGQAVVPQHGDAPDAQTPR